ncbi:glycosyl hydrolase family 28-related protein [Butyrivibrio sp. NC2007]|uniref:glycosyl hydrolase family 28-related protein n=1 Tax=Butyrivibrio sp. NC2007 TaxID=1280683 RepID=UPI0003B30F7E|nr:right-handed parallel beta-helix repeat-containing protein [Butyrivibrio sp. NC2007]
MTSYRRYLKRIIPCVVLFLALVVIVIFNLPNKKPSNPVIIPDDNTPLSDRIQAKASFYLFNPGDFTPDFTNVTPDLAEYIGEGTVYFTGDIYNNPSEVSSLIVSEPNYSSFLPSDKAVSWGSIYLYNESKEICVIGLSTDKSEVDPIAVDDPSSVRTYGAKGDGVTDDTAAIIETLKNNPDGKVYFPRGTYVISSRIRIPSNMQIIGDGASSVIIAAPGTGRGADMIKVDKATNVVFKNICISGNSSINYENMNDQDGIHLLELWNSDNITVDNCSFIDNVYTAIRNVGSSNVTITNCHFKNTDCGFITLGSAASIHDLTITNNSIDGHQSSEPISLFANSSHSNILIANNTIINKAKACGIFIGGKQHNNNVIIRDNTLNATASGIRVESSSDVQVLRNSISNTVSGCGIKVMNCDNVILDGNTCSNVQQDGLQITDCSDVTINKLTAINCGQATNDWVSIRFTGTKNSDITFTNSSIEYNNTTSKIGIIFNCETDIDMENITYSNASIWLTKKSANTSLSVPASVKIRDQGQENTVTTH